MGSVRNHFFITSFKDIYLIFQGLVLRYRFMGQLTLARFRGDTAFGLASRLLSTSLGGLTGLVIWYVLFPYSFHFSKKKRLTNDYFHLQVHILWIGEWKCLWPGCCLWSLFPILLFLPTVCSHFSCDEWCLFCDHFLGLWNNILSLKIIN